MTVFNWTNQTHDSDLQDAADWSPAGGPPGAADTAMFGNVSGTLTGSGTYGQVLFDRSALSFAYSLAVESIGTPISAQLDDGASVAFAPGAGFAVRERLLAGASSGTSTLRLGYGTLDTGATYVGVGEGAAGDAASMTVRTTSR